MKVVPFAPKPPETPVGKRPVYRWEIDSAFRPENAGAAWEVVGYRDA